MSAAWRLSPEQRLAKDDLECGMPAKGKPNGESCASDGDCRVGNDAGGGFGGHGVRAGVGGVVLTVERKRSSSSPPSLSSSASHRLLAAFLVCLAGGGEGFSKEPGECSGRGGSGSGCSGTVCLGSVVGDFARVGVCTLGAAEEGAMAHATSVQVETRRRQCRR
jgi:hypothetical protein